ncbi:MAG: hypothetical protein EAZ17_05205 [Sphingobacteriales bacterium]|nr:MAG: hypothetical protein EAZ17_05205 [Sphingobacteriales bacterium]
MPTMDIKMFYAELGKLLYAIADIDGVITPQERKELHELIGSRLTQREIHTDEYGTNDAWYAEFEFDVAEEQGLDPEDAFNSFAEFVDEYGKHFDERMREICLLLADRLAGSYHHINHREKQLLQRLKEVLSTVHIGHH